MKRILLPFLTYPLLAALNVNAQPQGVSSPDGRLDVKVESISGVPSYTVLYDEKTFLGPSPLGLETNVGDFREGMELSSVETSSVSDDYSLPNIKKSEVHYRAQKAVFTFSKDGKPAFDVVFQVSDNDIAFRYRVYPPDSDTKVARVFSESTGFFFPEGTTTFLCPQMPPMAGFARTTPSYETAYTADDTRGKNGTGFGYTFPCLFRIGEQGWVLVSETGVSSAYCGSRLLGNPDGTYSIGYPMEEEYNGNGTVAPGIPLPGYTAWRTLTVAKDLAPIVETTIPFDVVEPLYKPSIDYTYSKGSWSWIIKMDGSITYEGQKEYIDFSAAMGWQTVLVDNWWDTQIGRDRIEELSAYARGKGVQLCLWYNSNGYWNDAPQGPRDIMNSSITRKKEMAWLKSIGVKGIKVDFFGSDKQVTMQLYEDILSDANDFGLLVVFHGCTLPRGWERMYPNFASAEAVLASENLHFTQERCDTEAFHACLHPFIRNTVAVMDFGGSTLNKVYNATNDPTKPGTVRRTSDVFALATAVLFQSPIQHFAMAPNNLHDAPSWAVDFMQKVPTTWDDVKFIEGYPGKYIVMARRSGDKWFIVGINAEKGTRKIKLDTSMLKKGEAFLYSDSPSLQGKKESMKIGNAPIMIDIPSDGGFVLEQ